MDTQSDDDVLAAVAEEAKGTGGTARGHGEDVGAVDFGPSAAINIMPDGLLNNVEECVGIGLEDSCGDGVRHRRTIWIMQAGQ